MRVGRADTGAAVGRTADDDWATAETAGHVADAGSVADELVKGYRMEGPEHQFHYGTDAEHGGTDTHANESSLGDGCIDHALVAPLFPKAFGDFVGTIVLSDLLAHQDDIWIAGEFLIKAFTEGFTIGENTGHGMQNGDCGWRNEWSMTASVVEEMVANF